MCSMPATIPDQSNPSRNQLVGTHMVRQHGILTEMLQELTSGFNNLPYTPPEKHATLEYPSNPIRTNVSSTTFRWCSPALSFGDDTYGSGPWAMLNRGGLPQRTIVSYTSRNASRVANYYQHSRFMFTNRKTHRLILAYTVHGSSLFVSSAFLLPYPIATIRTMTQVQNSLPGTILPSATCMDRSPWISPSSPVGPLDLHVYFDGNISTFPFKDRSGLGIQNTARISLPYEFGILSFWRNNKGPEVITSSHLLRRNHRDHSTQMHIPTRHAITSGLEFRASLSWLSWD